MAEHALADRVNEIVDRIVARGDATAALRDPEVAPLARIAAELRHYANPDFKARLRASLHRRTTMTATMTTEAVREGFTTVTPYIRVASEGLVAFLASAFGAVETFAGRGGGRRRQRDGSARGSTLRRALWLRHRSVRQLLVRRIAARPELAGERTAHG